MSVPLLTASRRLGPDEWRPEPPPALRAAARRPRPRRRRALTPATADGPLAAAAPARPRRRRRARRHPARGAGQQCRSRRGAAAPRGQVRLARVRRPGDLDVSGLRRAGAAILRAVAAEPAAAISCRSGPSGSRVRRARDAPCRCRSTRPGTASSTSRSSPTTAIRRTRSRSVLRARSADLGRRRLLARPHLDKRPTCNASCGRQGGRRSALARRRRRRARPPDRRRARSSPLDGLDSRRCPPPALGVPRAGAGARSTASSRASRAAGVQADGRGPPRARRPRRAALRRGEGRRPDRLRRLDQRPGRPPRARQRAGRAHQRARRPVLVITPP